MEIDFKKYLSEHLKTQPTIIMPKFEYNSNIQMINEDEDSTEDKNNEEDIKADDLNPPEDLDNTKTDDLENSDSKELFGNEENTTSSENTEVKSNEIQKDPEFSAGTTDGKDISLTKTPPSAVTINFENINQVLDEYITTTQDNTLLDTITQLKNIDDVLSSGKKLNSDDVKFKDSAALKTVLKYLKTKLKIEDFNYLKKKIKEPLNADMIKQKEEIAKSTTNKNINVDNLLAVTSI